MKTILVTKYHGPTDTRGSRISVRGFVPGSGIVRKTYSYDYSGKAHDIAAREFLAEYFPGATIDEVRFPTDGKASTGNAYIVKEPLPDFLTAAIEARCQTLRAGISDCSESLAKGYGIPGKLEDARNEMQAELANLENLLA
jgi:hypothetical protein